MDVSNGSPKKRPHNETETKIIDNITENLTNEPLEFSEQSTSKDLEINIKRPRTDNDNDNSDSDFVQENNSKERIDNSNENNMKEEIDETELEKDHEYCLKRLYLKRIIRENHGSPIKQIVFNHQPLSGSEFDASNIVATVAKAGITIYDNEHCGNHFDIMAHFILNGQGYLPGPNGKAPTVEGQMNSMCWVNKIDDAIMVTAGEDKNIHILSLANCKEIAVLSGHGESVEDVISHTINNNIIISASQDGTIRIWDIYKEKCICMFITNYALTVMAINHKGDKLVVGTETGCIIECIIPEWVYNIELYNKELESNELPVMLNSDSDNQFFKIVNKKFHSAYIDSIGFINDNILSKDVNGHIYLWELESENIIREYKNRSLLRKNYCRFGISSDNSLFCVGTNAGTALIFDIEKGNVIKEVEHKRSTEPIRCSIFTRNCKSIIYTNENATIWRYDYVSNKQKKEWENWHHAHPEISNK